MSTDDQTPSKNNSRRSGFPSWLCAALLAAALLCGCAHRYDVSLTNGQRLVNVRKLTLNRQGGYYTFVDANGRTNRISAGRVVEINPHKNSQSSEFGQQ